jgi:hypothetical protein
VTIGGSVALHAWDLLGAPLEAELRRSARLDFTRDVRVVRAELGDSAGVFGAARLAWLALGFGYNVFAQRDPARPATDATHAYRGRGP